MVRLHLRGHDVDARPELVRDPEEVEQLLAVIRAANPSLDRFVRIPTGPDGAYERGPLRGAIAHGFCVVVWHLGQSWQHAWAGYPT